MEDHMRDDGTRTADDGLLEQVRALAEDRLSSADAEALLLRAAADPEDAALLAAFREVHAVTAVMESELPPCRVRFEDVEARIERAGKPPLRLWALRAAAAVLLGAVAAGAWSVWGPPAVPTVTLTAVRLAAAPPSSDPLADAALRAAAPLADYVPLRDGEPQWLASLDDGRAIARATGRPVLLFIHHPTCPMCLELRGETFRDSGVQARLGEFVPVMVDVTEMPEALAPLLQRGWPYLGALDADGEEVVAFPGVATASVFSGRLDDARTRFGDAEPLAWGRSRALAARLRDAVAAGAAGDLARETTGLASLRDDDDGAFGRAAGVELDALQADVADALRRAAADPDGASALLDDAASRYAGTPWSGDIESVREALRETGRFPRLESPPETEAH